MALSYTEILVEDETFHIFTLPDRRPTAGSSQPVKWLYQMIVESYLYHNGDEEARGTGAFYRLLQRTPGAAGRALCLRKASVGQGLVTDAEWDLLRKPLESSVRVLTLVPIDVAVKALTVYGETDRSAKLRRSSLRRSVTTGLPSGVRLVRRRVRRRARSRRMAGVMGVRGGGLGQRRRGSCGTRLTCAACHSLERSVR